MTPLTPTDCDLRDFQYMPLDVLRLRDSDLVALETPEVCVAAILLWCASWHQVPAASLPDDDRVLAKLAGYGRVVKEWQRIKEGALRNWIKCADGLLYHPVVAEKANEAWHSKLKYQWQKECERIRKANKKRAEENLPPLHFPPEPNLIPPEKLQIPAESVGHSTGNKEKFHGIPAENALKGEVREHKGELKSILDISSQDNSSEKSETREGDDTTSQDKYKPGATAAALIKLGVKVTGANPTLLAWIKDGYTLEQMLEAVSIARIYKQEPEPIPANYLDPILREPPAARKARPKPWWNTEADILAKAKEMNVALKTGESWPELKKRIQAAIDKANGK